MKSYERFKRMEREREAQLPRTSRWRWLERVWCYLGGHIFPTSPKYGPKCIRSDGTARLLRWWTCEACGRFRWEIMEPYPDGVPRPRWGGRELLWEAVEAGEGRELPRVLFHQDDPEEGLFI